MYYYLIKFFFKLLIFISLFSISFAKERPTEFTWKNVKYDVTKTWNKAYVYVPGKISKKRVIKFSSNSKYPVVILMHGCSGIKGAIERWSLYLKSLGFAVIVPNSFAIPKRKSNCDATKKTSGLGVPVHLLRDLEAVYALKQVSKLDWTDKNNIFLMGHSEGGIAASLAVDNILKGIIITGYHCYGGVPDTEIPILAINFEKDPWIKWKGYCQKNWGDRKKSKQIILKGTGHDSSRSEIAKKEVKQFVLR